MTLARLVGLSLGAMLLLAVVGAGLALWATERAEEVVRRVGLAYRSYETHALLRANVADLFKQYGDALLIGDRDEGRGEMQLRDAITGNLGTLRAIVAREIILLGDAEADELEDLAQIEALVRRLSREMEAIVARSELIVEVETEGEDEIEIDIAGGQDALAAILDTGVDETLRTRIEEAMAGEEREVREAEDAVARQFALARRASAALVLVAAALVAAGAWLWLSRVARPLARLLEGTRRLAEGRYDVRVGLSGRSEIADVGHVLDDLAGRVANRERALAEQNATLEAAAAERTEDLARALGAARAAEEARRLLLADVSHELRTPLTIIKGESEVALRGGDKAPSEYREALARVRDAAGHTAALVDDLLFIGRAESGRPRLALREFDLFELLRQAVAMAEPGVPVLCDLLPAPIRADRNRLRQAVLALLSNARRYGGPELRVRAERTETGYRVRVEDDGPGLTPEEREMGFTRFWRGPGGADGADGGTGLGLPVVRAIAEAHGGTARLDAREGGGTVAILELPRDAEEAA